MVIFGHSENRVFVSGHERRIFDLRSKTHAIHREAAQKPEASQRVKGERITPRFGAKLFARKKLHLPGCGRIASI
jgi:hypothetical protein